MSSLSPLYASNIILHIGIFESVSHWSPAKLLTGYKVVATSNQPLGVGRVMLRTLCRMIPFIALFAIFIFMLIQAGFSAALMSYCERVWDKDSQDSPSALLLSLFAWFPVLGWMVCSRPTSDVENAFGHKNSEHPDYDSFVSRGRGVRRSLRFYHIISTLIVIVVLTSRWNKITLITIGMLFLFAFVFVSISWFRYTKRLTQSQELATIEHVD